MSDENQADAWTFVQVDPTAPKKRRKKRKKLSKSPPRQINDIPDDLLHPSAADAGEQDGGDDEQVHQEMSGGSDHDPDLTDFERFVMLSTENSEVARWADLFGEITFTPWSPLATTALESALIDFYAMETVKASVSFDDPSNPFRSALLPLAVSDPSTFHAALAVAGIHWVNRIRMGTHGTPITAIVEKKIRILSLASAYHQGIAQDLVRRPLNKDLNDEEKQAAEESRAAFEILKMIWHTFSDGYVDRPQRLKEVHRVLGRYADKGMVTRMGRFLRIWLCWVDTLDTTAHRRARLTWDHKLEGEAQEEIDRAIQRTVGCPIETLHLIARTSALAYTSQPDDLPSIKRNAFLSAELQDDILSNINLHLHPSEETLAAQAFALAAHLYFMTAVPKSSLDHPSLKWAVSRLIDILHITSEASHSQAWATWPYFMLGLHVIAEEHQDLVRARFHWLESTLSVGNLTTLRMCLEELWDRRKKGIEVPWQE